tara:strand:- start:255 stop:590 length:336 start_codon:yes stop_codon:yes gene_type:complete
MKKPNSVKFFRYINTEILSLAEFHGVSCKNEQSITNCGLFPCYRSKNENGSVLSGFDDDDFFIVKLGDRVLKTKIPEKNWALSFSAFSNKYLVPFVKNHSLDALSLEGATP